jgi:hypothetical protein
MIRTEIKSFQQIPNVGKATESDFKLLGLEKPLDLVDKDPYQMYQTLCNITKKQHDPCVIDVFISAVEYMKGGPAKKWWEFTQQRKEKLRCLN